MTSLELIKEMVKDAREILSGTVADVTVEMMHVEPGNKALPLGATWAHIVFSEDAIVHGMLQAKPALFDTTFKDNTGASTPMPPMDASWSENNILWAKSVKFDLVKFRAYEKAVYNDTDAYIRTLHEDEMTVEKDLGSWGKKALWYLLSGYIVEHMCSVTGEISVLKGLQGLKGYPF